MSDDMNALGMSDEDFLNESPSSFDISQEEAETSPTDGDATEEELDAGTETDEADADTDEGADEADDNDDDEEGEAEADAESDESDDDDDEAAKDEADKAADGAVDFEAEYNKILAPFKANGVDMQVNTPEEAVQLMQKGANYTKKMQGLQPSLKLLKMLEKNELLDETKLNYLINVNEGNPEAISKLIQDKGVVLDDFEAGESKEFKAKDYTVSEAEMKVASVLSSIEGTATYDRTIDTLTNKWDLSSKQTLSATPKLIADINEHMSNGIFDQVNSEVERQRTFGGLTGLSDYDAYMAVGKQIHQAGGFNTEAAPKPKPVATTKVPSKSKDVARANKRKAASSTKSTAAKAVPKEYNPLSLSDADFAKLL